MRCLSISGSHNGSPIGVVARHHDGESLPARYLEKYKPKPAKHRNHTTKLTEEQVYEVRHDKKKGMTNRAIARKFLVHESMISLIVNRKLWQWLPERKNPNDSCQHLFAKR